MSQPDLNRVAEILESVRALAIQYRQETGKPLGITGEMAEFHAARLLRLDLCDARQPGYDATLKCADGSVKHSQIKGRCVSSSYRSGRLGGIKLSHDWDSVLLVLLDEDFRPVAIYEAKRAAIEQALTAPGSRARNERGALSISKFESLAECVWPS